MSPATIINNTAVAKRGVAIEVLRPELAAALGPNRFLREITLTARLDHPYILPLLDSGEADGPPVTSCRPPLRAGDRCGHAGTALTFRGRF